MIPSADVSLWKIHIGRHQAGFETGCILALSTGKCKNVVSCGREWSEIVTASEIQPHGLKF